MDVRADSGKGTASAKAVSLSSLSSPRSPATAPAAPIAPAAASAGARRSPVEDFFLPFLSFLRFFPVSLKSSSGSVISSRGVSGSIGTSTTAVFLSCSTSLTGNCSLPTSMPFVSWPRSICLFPGSSIATLSTSGSIVSSPFAASSEVPIVASGWERVLGDCTASSSNILASPARALRSASSCKAASSISGGTSCS